MHTWANDFRTYEEACIYYGADTPAQLAAEAAYDRELEAIETQDELEAWGGASARSHAIGVAHREWCRSIGITGPTESELAEIVLWGRTESRGLPAVPRSCDCNDDIPF